MIVFDMAGTVVDEKNVVYKTLQQALQRGGFDFDLDTVLLNGGGKEKFQAIKDLMSLKGSAKKAPADEIFKDFLQLLEKAYQELEVKTYPGVESLLHRLKSNKIKVVLNTGYNSFTANTLLDKMGWQSGQEYDLLVTADQVENSRPAPDMIYLAMQKLGVTDKKLVAKVGDSVIDIEEGKSAGCGFTVGVTTGAHTREQLSQAHPDLVLESLSELDAHLAKINV